MLAARDLSLRRRRGNRSPGIPGMAGLLITLTVASGIALGHLQSFATASQAQRAITRFLDSEEPWTQAVKESDRLIRQANAALENDRDNAELHDSLGKLWVNRFRQQSYAKLDESEEDDRYSPEDIWASTSPTYIHLIASRERLAGRSESLAQIRSLPQISDNLVHAIRHFRTAARVCPALPGVDVQIARLGVATDLDRDSTDSLLAAVSKSPTNMFVLYSAGLIAFYEEQDELCFSIWRQYLKLYPTAVNYGRVLNRNFETIFSVLATRHPFELVIERVMPEYGPFYPRFMSSSAATKALEPHFPRIYEKMLGSLDADPQEESGDWHFLRATALRALQREDEAIAAYRQSFLDDAHSIERRMELIKYLQSLGRLDEAFDEGGVCRHLAPERPDVEELVRQIARECNQ
jgi:tetratricopeptide (TPR) repeat protein